MKLKLLFFLLVLVSKVYSAEEHTPIQQSVLGQALEKSVILCNGDTCTKATLSRYDDARDHLGVTELLEKNQSKLPETTPESLAPFFNHKIENIEQGNPAGLAVSGTIIHTTYVLRTTEKVVGFISYQINAMKQPAQVTVGNIVLLCADQLYQEAGEKQLLDFVLQDLSHKKSSMVSIMIHKDNSVQRSIVEQIGFIDNSQAIEAAQQRTIEQLKKTGQEITAAALEKQFQLTCCYMKTLEENVTEEMKHPAPIESTLLSITKANYEQEVLNASKPVIIDVYTDWCCPCRHFAPIFEKAAAINSNYKFVRFNCVEGEQELADKLGIKMFPTILFIKNKEIVGRETGFMNQETLQQKLISYFN